MLISLQSPHVRCRCGECLGLLGALDPARVAVERRAPPDLVDQDQERGVAGGDKGGGSEATGALARSNGGGGQYALEVSLVENLVRGSKDEEEDAGMSQRRKP